MRPEPRGERPVTWAELAYLLANTVGRVRASSRRMVTASSIAARASSRRPRSDSPFDWLFSDVARSGRKAPLDHRRLSAPGPLGDLGAGQPRPRCTGFPRHGNLTNQRMRVGGQGSRPSMTACTRSTRSGGTTRRSIRSTINCCCSKVAMRQVPGRPGTGSGPGPTAVGVVLGADRPPRRQPACSCARTRSRACSARSSARISSSGRGTAIAHSTDKRLDRSPSGRPVSKHAGRSEREIMPDTRPRRPAAPHAACSGHGCSVP